MDLRGAIGAGTAAAALAALAGCGWGGEDDAGPEARNAPPADTRPALPPGRPEAPPGSLALPPGVPREGSPTRTVPVGAERPVRGWLSATRKADFARAAGFFSVPVRVQNGTPVLTLGSKGAVRAFLEALPCGAVLTRLEGAGGDFVVARVRLVDRRGSSCDAGAGATARVALRVRDGLITEWYRLPGPGEDGPGSLPAPTSPS